MHLTETTLDIVGCLGKSPFIGSSIRALAQKLGKAYPLVHKHVTHLVAEGLLHEEHIGKARHCTLNLAHPQTQSLLGYLIERQPQHNTLKKQVHNINTETPLVTAFLDDKKTVFVTHTKQEKQKLKKELPYDNIIVLSAHELTPYIYTLQHNPQPLIHAATFYDYLSIRQTRWNL